MAAKRATIKIAGTSVKIVTGTYGNGIGGKTQTVNVFDDSNTEGNYSQVYRLPSPDVFVTPELVAQNAGTLDELGTFLEERGASKEGPRTKTKQQQERDSQKTAINFESVDTIIAQLRELNLPHLAGIPGALQDIAETLQSGTGGEAPAPGHIAGTSAGYNRIPSKVSGPCTPLLIAFCFDDDTFSGRLAKILAHAAKCPNTQEIIFVTSQWQPAKWKRYEAKFQSLSASVTILFAGFSRLIRLS